MATLAAQFLSIEMKLAGKNRRQLQSAKNPPEIFGYTNVIGKMRRHQLS